MACGDTRHAVGAHLYLVAGYEAVSADYLSGLRIPHYQLAAWRLHCVKFIDITVFAGSASGRTKGDFSESSDLAHYVRRRKGVDDIYLVATLVGVAQQPVGSEFHFEELYRYRVNHILIGRRHHQVGMVDCLNYIISFLFSAPVVRLSVRLQATATR